MMLKRVYVETTVISYLTAWPSKNPIVRRDQEITKSWWTNCRGDCELFTSNVVVEEAKLGDPTAAKERLVVLNSLSLIRSDPQARKLSRKLVKAGAVPETERADALHIAIAAVAGMDYLVTWNMRHINNPVTHGEIDRICRKAGFEPPVIRTPRQLEEAQHV